MSDLKFITEMQTMFEIQGERYTIELEGESVKMNRDQFELFYLGVMAGYGAQLVGTTMQQMKNKLEQKEKKPRWRVWGEK